MKETAKKFRDMFSGGSTAAKRPLAAWVASLALAVLLSPVIVYAVTTTATSDGNWDVPGNWDNGAPAAGGDAVIPAGRTITNTSGTANLNSLTNSGALVFSGWDSAVTATVVYVSGTITHLPQSDTNGADGWTPDNRVWFVCTNFDLNTNGTIDVSGKGYRGGNSAEGYVNGYGPGRGLGGWDGNPPNRGRGGGYGGKGAYSDNSTKTSGVVYGNAQAPNEPGSGGGALTQNGGAGGGLVRLQVAGQLTVNGNIRANGTNTAGGGGGSGGGIYLACNTFAGTNGLVMANGGNAYTEYGSGGGGGRIAVTYNEAAQSGFQPTVRFVANRGINTDTAMTHGRPGTLYFPDAGFFPSSACTNLMGGQIVIPGFTNWGTPSLLIVSNGYVVLPNSFVLRVTNNLTLDTTTSVLELQTNSQAVVGGNLVLSNGAALYIYSAPTNASTMNYGALVSVGGMLRIYTNSWIYPVSDGTNGGSVKFEIGDLNIALGGGFNTCGSGFWAGYGDAQPFIRGYGPGGGLRDGSGNPAGGGYGGLGGGPVGYAGVTNGSLTYPLYPGSGGCGGWGYNYQYGGVGGGLIWLDVTRTATLNGTLKADGVSAGTGTPGGSGGAIYLRCRSLAGSTATLQAKGGGWAAGAGGGGGRIAVWRVFDFANTNGWTIQVNGGAGQGGFWDGATGTVFWSWLPAPGAIFTIR